MSRKENEVYQYSRLDDQRDSHNRRLSTFANLCRRGAQNRYPLMVQKARLHKPAQEGKKEKNIYDLKAGEISKKNFYKVNEPKPDL